MPSTGAMIDSLVGSGVSHYSGFKLLQGIGLYIEERNERETGYIRPVPTSKEDIFKDPNMSRIDKLKLMRFLRHIASQDVLLDGVCVPVASNSELPTHRLPQHEGMSPCETLFRMILICRHPLCQG